MMGEGREPMVNETVEPHILSVVFMLQKQRPCTFGNLLVVRFGNSSTALESSYPGES